MCMSEVQTSEPDAESSWLVQTTRCKIIWCMNSISDLLMFGPSVCGRTFSCMHKVLWSLLYLSHLSHGSAVNNTDDWDSMRSGLFRFIISATLLFLQEVVCLDPQHSRINSSSCSEYSTTAIARPAIFWSSKHSICKPLPPSPPLIPPPYIWKPVIVIEDPHIIRQVADQTICASTRGHAWATYYLCVRALSTPVNICVWDVEKETLPQSSAQNYHLNRQMHTYVCTFVFATLNLSHRLPLQKKSCHAHSEVVQSWNPMWNMSHLFLHTARLTDKKL